MVGELTQETGKTTGVLVNFTLGLLGDLRSESLHSSSSDSERKHMCQVLIKSFHVGGQPPLFFLQLPQF